MDKEWIIEEVIGISDSQYGKKFAIKLKDYEHEVSGFTKFVQNIVAGGKIFGHVEVKGSYHNWKWGKNVPKADSGPAAGNAATAELKNILNLRIIPLLEKLEKEVVIISERMDMMVNGQEDPMPRF